MNKYYVTPPIEPLTEEERKSPYAFLYDVPAAAPDDELLENFRPGNTMDPAKALPITEAYRIFDPAGLEVPNGYCLLPDGGAYHACYIEMKHVTPEMEAWWSNSHWLMQNDVHYKVWLPGFHYSHKFPIVEDFGWGVGNVDMVKPLRLEDVEKRDVREINPAYLNFSAANGLFTPLDDPSQKMAHTIMHFMKKLDNGSVAVQTVVWHGIHLIDGKKVMTQPDIDLEKVRLFACHNVYETTRKDQILPQLVEISKSLN